MPDTRRHRGPDPEDERLFRPEACDRMREATHDLVWLLTRGYAMPSANALVGNRYALAARQRLAVARCACSFEAARSRASREVGSAELRGRELWIDGLNVLTGLEVALSGGIILVGCDGCCRDLAGVHRHYRRVEETATALRLIADLTTEWGVLKCRWWLDKPVSNTGRVKMLILQVAAEAECDWDVELVYSPDGVLSRTNEVVASSDSVILDRCERWTNLVGAVIGRFVPNARVIRLTANGLCGPIAPGDELRKSDCDERDQRKLH